MNPRPTARSSSIPLMIFLLLALAACGRAQPRVHMPLATTSAPAPTLTVTLTPAPPTATSAPSASPTPTQAVYQSPTPTPTNTRVPVTTPAGGAEAYRLQPWDRSTALRVVQGAANLPIPEEYQDLRAFYRVSMLIEAMLNFPEYQQDPNFLRDMSQATGMGPSYFASYGLLHDHSAEPFRQLLENALNQGETSLEAMESWVKNQGAMYYDPGMETHHLFEEPIFGQVIRVNAAAGWDWFIIRKDEPGGYSVRALYPEWERYWWNDETLQITDLNGNGRDEIAITHDDWGTGMSHFCRRSFHLYEWDGAVFVDRMSDPLEVYQGTDYGRCMDITFLPNPAGGQKIQAGFTLNTLCPEMPYEHILRYAWTEQGFKKELDQIHPPSGSTPPSRCSIDWAIKAGPDNDTALALLAAGLQTWPKESEQDWGPAGRDYLRLKLATWYFQRDQAAHGLALLQQVRDHPAASQYPLPAQVAAEFLDAYQKGNLYLAVQAVDALYQKEKEPYCGIVGCNVEKLREAWGFSEREWEIEYAAFQDDFQDIPAITLAIQQKPPARLEDLYAWLEGSQLHPVWSAESDLDGQGQPDWLAVTERKREEYSSKTLYAFLRSGKQVVPVRINSVYFNLLSADEAIRWQSFRPAPGGPVLIVFQTGPRLHVFHLRPENGSVQVAYDLNTWNISTSAQEERVLVQDWKIEAGKLIVQYQGRSDPAVYQWDTAQGRLIPTGFAPDLQEENVRRAEQAIFMDNQPAQAVDILNTLLSGRVWENYYWAAGVGITNPPRLRPYVLYLLGLAYERSGDEARAVQTYWQLWHDYPENPYSLATQSKLEKK